MTKAEKKAIKLIKEIKQIVASAPTPEMRDELATKYLFPTFDFIKRLKVKKNKLKEKESKL